jgi:uncharacterized repeat protein (TIGR03803 family)
MSTLRSAVALLAFTAISPVAHAAPKLTTLYSFQGTHDGVEPGGPLVQVGNVLYGSTFGGAVNGAPMIGFGTLYAVDLTTGIESTVYRFEGGADGANPFGGLFYRNGLLYGRTAWGGTSNNGILFAYNIATGAISVLLNFSDYYLKGAFTPSLSYHDALYGVGGSQMSDLLYNYGFKSGKQKLIVNGFGGGGFNCPPAALSFVSKNGTLFGTVACGGNGPNANGAVFSLNLNTGAESYLYNFNAQAGGTSPSSVVLKDGVYYGTTWQGGAANLGTVFKLTSGGVETVLYSFQGGADGAYANDVAYGHGDLYGTTEEGGGGNCVGPGPGGCGSVFKIDLATGAKTTIHDFTGTADGGVPSSPLIRVGRAWYGTTAGGGSPPAGTCTFPGEGYTGCGTMFKITE